MIGSCHVGRAKHVSLWLTGLYSGTHSTGKTEGYLMGPPTNIVHVLCSGFKPRASRRLFLESQLDKSFKVRMVLSDQTRSEYCCYL